MASEEARLTLRCPPPSAEDEDQNFEIFSDDTATAPVVNNPSWPFNGSFLPPANLPKPTVSEESVETTTTTGEKSGAVEETEMKDADSSAGDPSSSAADGSVDSSGDASAAEPKENKKLIPLYPLKYTMKDIEKIGEQDTTLSPWDFAHPQYPLNKIKYPGLCTWYKTRDNFDIELRIGRENERVLSKAHEIVLRPHFRDYYKPTRQNPQYVDLTDSFFDFGKIKFILEYLYSGTPNRLPTIEPADDVYKIAEGYAVAGILRMYELMNLAAQRFEKVVLAGGLGIWIDGDGSVYKGLAMVLAIIRGLEDCREITDGFGLYLRGMFVKMMTAGYLREILDNEVAERTMLESMWIREVMPLFRAVLNEGIIEED